jgi:hypothetical protein
MDAMQFRHALDCILRETLLANLAFGLVYLIKLDINNGFYHIALNVDDIPNLGVAFPTAPGKEPLVAFPLVLPMGWKNSPPVFSTATETIADLVNMRLQHLAVPIPHHLDNLAESIPSPDPAVRHPRSLPHVTRDPFLSNATSTFSIHRRLRQRFCGGFAMLPHRFGRPRQPALGPTPSAPCS